MIDTDWRMDQWIERNEREWKLPVFLDGFGYSWKEYYRRFITMLVYGILASRFNRWRMSNRWATNIVIIKPGLNSNNAFGYRVSEAGERVSEY